MKWELAKSLAIKAAPVVLGVLLGVGGTKAVSPPANSFQADQPIKVILAEPLKCEPKVIIEKPDPINVEFIRK